jgi:hypothetical protein
MYPHPLLISGAKIYPLLHHRFFLPHTTATRLPRSAILTPQRSVVSGDKGVKPRSVNLGYVD